jgi:hypothetical protein
MPLRTAALIAIAGIAASRIASASDGEHHLRQWRGPDGVVNLDDGQHVESYVHRWVDKDGVSHITVGPSREARERAQKLSLVPRATGEVTKVHETSQWDWDIAHAAEKYNVPESVVRAVIVAESNFQPTAISHAGACGLMQLMPHTAAAMYVNNLFDPVENIYGGTRYLRVLANMFGGDLRKTIAAYNAGPDAVRKAGGIPAIPETQSYVRKVMKLYGIYRGPY